MLNTVYRDNVLKKITKWVKHLHEDCGGYKDHIRSRYSFSLCYDKNIDLIQSCMFSNQRITVQMTANNLNIGKFLCTQFELKNCNWESCVLKEKGWIFHHDYACCSFLCRSLLILNSKFHHDVLSPPPQSTDLA